jgi:hypothetical protein
LTYSDKENPDDIFFLTFFCPLNVANRPFADVVLIADFLQKKEILLKREEKKYLFE